MAKDSVERRGGGERRSEAEAPVSGPSHQVLVNLEDQHCLWPAEKNIPEGWKSVFNGEHQDCLDFVEKSWADMRPKSNRLT